MQAVMADAVARGTYILDEQFTAADVVIGSGLRWGTMVALSPERQKAASQFERLNGCPALQRSSARDDELAASFAG